MKRYYTLALFTIAVLLGACSNESAFPNASGKGNVRAINTIATAPAFSFLIEERLLGTIDFGTSSVTNSYDDLEYTFNFEVALLGATRRTRVASQFLDVVKNKDYTFVLSGAIDAPTITLWEADVREWSGEETVFEVRFAHAAPSLGDVDVYLAEATDPPTAPVAGAAQGTLAFGEVIPAADYAGGEYILTVTDQGDETAILFQSDPFTPASQTSIILTVFDGDDLAPVSVSVVNATGGAGSSRLRDSSVLPTMRFFHASINAGDTDIYVEDPLTTPLVMNHTFPDVTGDLEVPAGDLPVTYTTAGNMGSVLVDVDQTLVAGTHYNLYFIETDAGEDAVILSPRDRRSVETLSKLGFINTSTNYSAVDLYAVEADTTIDEVPPFIASLPLGASPVTVPLIPISYDLYVTAPGEKDVLAGPVRVDLAGGEIRDILIYDNADPATADVVVIAPP